MAMGKLKLSLLSYIIVQKRLSLTKTPTSKYETTSPLSVVFFSINSEGYLSFSKEGLFKVSKSSILYLNVLEKNLALDMLFFYKPFMNLYSKLNKYRFAKRGAQSVPIGIPMHCRKTLLPTSTYMLYTK